MDCLNNDIMEEMGVSMILEEELCTPSLDDTTPNNSQSLPSKVLMPTDANSRNHVPRGICHSQGPKHKRTTPSKHLRKSHSTNSFSSESQAILLSGQAENSLDDISEEFFLFKRRRLDGPLNRDDVFARLPDELMVHIFYWLPKSTLGRCAQVCKRWKRLAYEKIFWRKLDLSDRSLNPGTLEIVLQRSPEILRLAKTTIREPVIHLSSLESVAVNTLYYLDLSMASISPSDLFTLLNGCKGLRKLSLENCIVSDAVCSALADNLSLEVLNMSMVRGLTLTGLKSILADCLKLQEWNLAWTQLSADAVDLLSNELMPSIERLNVSGCRDTLQDSHIQRLCQRCPSLVELDISDAVALTSNAVEYVSALAKLESLSMSRCYNILPAAFLSLQDCRSLVYLNIFGSYPDSALCTLKGSLLGTDINRFMFSSIARPTVGFRRTSVWGLRIRD